MLVTGVTGSQAASVARSLFKEGHELSGITRNTESPQALEDKALKQIAVEEMRPYGFLGFEAWARKQDWGALLDS